MLDNVYILFGLATIIGYLLGSIPFGLVITKLAGLGDIRDIGSGNIGATNVLRTGRKDLALTTFILDSGKAGIAAILFFGIALTFAPNFNPTIAIYAGAIALFGHCFPVWLGFKGGKGVATYFGMLFASVPILGLAAAVFWLTTAFFFKMSSLGALVAAFLVPILAWGFGFSVSQVIILTAVSALIFYRHKANLSRILNGTEPKFGQAKTKASEA